jgi:hypothetical protein
MIVEFPIRFPKQVDVIYERAVAFRRLTPTERFLRIRDLIASGQKLLEQSPRREAGRRLKQAQEDEWRRIQKELFARHGDGSTESL